VVTDRLPALGFTPRRGPLALAWGDNHGTRRRAPDAELGADRAEIAADTISRRREIARRAVLARRRPMLLRGAAGKLLLPSPTNADAKPNPNPSPKPNSFPNPHPYPNPDPNPNS